MRDATGVTCRGSTTNDHGCMRMGGHCMPAGQVGACLISYMSIFLYCGMQWWTATHLPCYIGGCAICAVEQCLLFNLDINILPRTLTHARTDARTDAHARTQISI